MAGWHEVVRVYAARVHREASGAGPSSTRASADVSRGAGTGVTAPGSGGAASSGSEGADKRRGVPSPSSQASAAISGCLVKGASVVQSAPRPKQRSGTKRLLPGEGRKASSIPLHDARQDLRRDQGSTGCAQRRVSIATEREFAQSWRNQLRFGTTGTTCSAGADEVSAPDQAWRVEAAHESLRPLALLGEEDLDRVTQVVPAGDRELIAEPRLEEQRVPWHDREDAARHGRVRNR
jgi:hypothetical protein